MQKPDDSNDPHPLYQPMKPDVPDYKPDHTPDHKAALPLPPSNNYGKYETENVAGDKKVQNTPTPELTPTQTPKQNWFARLSRRTKIIAGVILLIVIFVAAFVPAYLTTHNNNNADTTNTTSPTNTTIVPSGARLNFTDAGLPINNATYRISISGGRDGCNQYLSVVSCPAGTTVDMYSGDDSKINVSPDIFYESTISTFHIYR
jgi:hypothetical protein